MSLSVAVLRQSISSYLHDETFQRYAVVSVAIVVVELEIIVKDEGRLHMSRHRYPDGRGARRIRVHNGIRVRIRKVEAVPVEFT